jgi:aerobic-type carbon monoxide dehydrogenase small subunit (CoxS/CutS family)
MMTTSLLRENADPSREQVRDYLSGNLCRCGSYVKIEEAVLAAAARMRGAEAGSEPTDAEGTVS